MDHRSTPLRLLGRCLQVTLLAAVTALVVGFRSSDNLAAAYGIAVTMAVMIDSILIFVVMRRLWRWPLAAAVAALEKPARDRAITVADLNQLRLWVESQPEVPEGDWYKDFGSFKICGQGALPRTFLLRGQAVRGVSL